jgi:L-ascorbate metabolism protein UlaG (beta-lactamase superfamily)
MHISWFGLSAFKIETKDAVIVTDPFGAETAGKSVRAKADIVTISHAGGSSQSILSGIQGEPFIIDHPGEFEVKGVFVQGISARSPGERTAKQGSQQDPVPEITMFTLDLEGMRLAHLGDLRDVPESTLLENMDGVDVLFLPVGGGSTLDAEGAMRVLNDIEPHMIIPMHFAAAGIRGETKLAPVTAFLKEMGASSVTPVERLLLKKRDLPTEETRVVVFRP